ncbi:MAG TPA: MFS transporter, partial [Candidatus Binatia bacterium]|nr:MFS transporter [Candidatus Binatia bacterium]
MSETGRALEVEDAAAMAALETATLEEESEVGTANGEAEAPEGVLAVLRNRSFLLLWLSQAATQIGGNMVLYGLTVVVLETTESKTAVSGLMLTFLVPAVLFSAVAGVFVDRFDAKPVLWVTNLLRGLAIGAMIFVQAQLLVIYLLNIFVSTVTTFFSPAEAAMIPRIVPRNQLVAANSIFTITLNAAFALGFALFGSLSVTLVGPTGLIAIVAALYLMAALFCFTLPSAADEAEHEAVSRSQTVSEAEKAVSSTFGQLREGLTYIRQNS